MSKPTRAGREGKTVFVTVRQNAGQASGGSLWRADAAQTCETIALSLALSRAFVAGVGEGDVAAAARQRVSDLMTHRGKKRGKFVLYIVAIFDSLRTISQIA